MKRLAVQTNSVAQPEASKAIVASLSRAAETSLQFHSAIGGNRRIARRPASQQSVVRQHNTNPQVRRALRVDGGGTSGGISLDLEFPQFTGIAARRDAPLLPLQMVVSTLKLAEPFSGVVHELAKRTAGSKIESLSDYKPLFRDRGIND